jgi:hypothetical protein
VHACPAGLKSQRRHAGASVPCHRVWRLHARADPYEAEALALVRLVAEGVGDETLGADLGAPEVSARKTTPADVKLPCDADRDRLEPAIVPRLRQVVFMGVGFYGRDWRGAQTTDLVWADVQRIRSADKPRAARGPSAELMLSYSRDGAGHTAFFPDAEAIDAKLLMLLERHPHIRGVYCWVMGQEDPAAWKVLRERLY